MVLRVAGAGVGRTGTESLKLALERLLGAPCYHMLEVIQRQQFAPWSAAGRGELPDWDEVFAGYAAAVDWPAAAYWPEIAAAYPDAIVLLSTRTSAEEWYRSASATIFAIPDGPGDADVMAGIFGRFGADPRDPEAAMAAYEAHNQRVRDTVPSGRLVEWQPGDGWAPLCAALGLPVPDEAFPHVNTTAMFEQRLQEMRGAP
ncbi:MAG: sulfotransferase family protein [Acidimicrobiales bacterium]